MTTIDLGDGRPVTPPLAPGEQAAATLVVDLASATVTDANPAATALAPGLTLPIALADWSAAAGLQDDAGRSLDAGALAQVALDAGGRGVRASVPPPGNPTAPRRHLWLVGVALGRTDGALAGRALIVLLPRRAEPTDRATTQVSEDLYARAATASDLSFTIADPHQPDAPLVWVNPAFETVTGYSFEDVVGRNCRFLQGPGTDPEALQRIREGLRDGRMVAETVLNYRADGTAFWNQLVISPVRDGRGEITHFVGIQADVTARWEAQRERDQALVDVTNDRTRLELLARVTDGLAGTLERSAAATELAETVVPDLADWGFVALVDHRHRFDRLHVAVTREDDRADAEALEAAGLEWLIGTPAIRAALRDKHSAWPEPFPIHRTDLPEQIEPEQLARLERLGLGTALVAPLRARGTVTGVLVLVRRDGFSQAQTVTAGHVAQRAGLALDNVRLYQRERAAALTLQRRMLPTVPTVEGLDIAATYLPARHPAEVGGDWFDVLPLPDGSIGLAVGDVVGHDLTAAASMGQLRSVLRSYAWSGAAPDAVVDHLDELVRGLQMADIATCTYLRLRGGDLEYSRAGHPPPLVLHPDGTVTALDGALRTPVGVADTANPTSAARAELPVGALLVLYSDGLVERRDRSLRDGLAALRATLGQVPTGSTAEQARDLLVTGLLGPVQEDDVCLLVVKRLA